MMPATTPITTPTATMTPMMRRLRPLVFAVTVAITLSSVIAAAFGPILVRDAPLVLLLLQPTSAQMLLVSAKVDLVPFVVIATLRRLLSDFAFYLLGLWYGDRAVAWLKRKAGSRRGMIETTERVFPKVAPPLIFFWVSPLVSVLAGATGMTVRFFVGLKLIGTLVVVFAHRFVADAASGPLSVAVRFIEGNAVWLTLVTMAITALFLLRNRGRNGSPFGSVRDIEEPESPAVVSGTRGHGEATR